MTFKVKTKGQNEGEKLIEPKLRFKEFKDEWKEISLKKTFTFFSTNSLSRADLTTDGLIKNIHYGDIHQKFNNILDIENEKLPYINQNIELNIKNGLCQNGDLIFADASEDYEGIGKAIEIINVGNNKVVSGLHTIHARDIESIMSIGFKGYLFNTPIIHNQVRILANGFKVFGISKDDICNLHVRIPNKMEQEKISNLLSLLDKKIELQKRRIEALKIYKRGLIKKILNSKITLSWDTFKLKDLLNPGSKNRILDTSKYQKINIKLNFNGLCKNTSLKEMADTRPFYIRHTNEIIIGKQNYFNGSIAIVSPDFDGCICSNAIMSFNAKSDNPKYIYYYISQPDYIKRREFLANGTGQKELSENEFLNFTIHIPSLDTQNRIVTILDSIESKIVLENSKLTYLNSLKTSLLQQMFI